MSEAPRNSEGFTEAQLWEMLEGKIGIERVSILIDIAEFQGNAEEWDSAFAVAESAVVTARETDNEQILARALLTRAYINRALEKYSEGAADALEGAHIFERYEAWETILSYSEAARDFFALEEFSEALKYVDVAIESGERATSDEPIGHQYFLKFEILKSLGREGEELLECLSKARQEFRKYEIIDGVTDSDDRASDILIDSGDYVAAHNLLQDCFNVYIDRDAGKAAYFAFRLGRVKRIAGDYESAITSLRHSLEYNAQHQHIVPLGSCQLELARCLWALKDQDEALNLISRARANFDVVGADSRVLDADRYKSIWLHNLGSPLEAAVINERIFETAEGFQAFAAKVRYADNLRQGREYAKALEATMPGEGEEEFYETAFWFWREEIRARILMQLDRNEEALQIAERCVNMNIKAAFNASQGYIYHLYGHILEEKGDREGAYHWWTRAVAHLLAADMVYEAKELSAKFMETDNTEETQ